MRLILCDTNPNICAAWRMYFVDEKVEIIEGTFTNVLDFDCIVSPANSFGIMDGGFDGALATYNLETMGWGTAGWDKFYC